MGFKFQFILVVSVLSTACQAEPPLAQQIAQPNPLGTRYSASTDVSHVAYKSPLLTLGSLEEVHLPAAPLIDGKGALRNDLKFGDDIQRYGKLESLNTNPNENQLSNENTLATVSNSQPVVQPQQSQNTQPQLYQQQQIENLQKQLYQQQLNNQIYQQQAQQFNQQLSQTTQQQQQYNPYQLDQFQQYNHIQQLSQINQLQELAKLQNGQQTQSQYAFNQPQIQLKNQLDNQFQQYRQLNQPELNQFQQYNQVAQPVLGQQFNQPINSAETPKVQVAFTNGVSSFNYGF